jgi:hypothetical protein
MAELSALLLAGSYLLDTSRPKPAPDLKAVLLSRLDRYYAHLGQQPKTSSSNSLEDVQLETAKEAFNIVDLAHEHFRAAPDADQSGKTGTTPPALGTRDVAELRTLLSITFKWGIEPLFIHVSSAWTGNSTPTVCGGPQIDLSATPEAYRSLSSTLARLLGILFPRDEHTHISQTIVTKILLDRHMPDLLGPCIALGWLPKSLASELMPTVDEIRPLVIQLLNMYVHVFLAIHLTSLHEKVYHPPKLLPLWALF